MLMDELRAFGRFLSYSAWLLWRLLRWTALLLWRMLCGLGRALRSGGERAFDAGATTLGVLMVLTLYDLFMYDGLIYKIGVGLARVLLILSIKLQFGIGG